MKKKEMITYSGEELMQMELPPVRFVVKDFLSQGLNILAGQAKVGKSWMMLDLCIKVAKGEKFFGFDTEKSTVLYLCLEDSPNRIRDRMVKLTDTAPANLHFAVMADNLAGDLTKQIESFIDKHPDTSLVVIDTLQKIRKAKGDMYAGDYKVISILKRLAERRGISIVCVHHTRKKSDRDPFNTVSGSTGITGAADNIYVMKTDDSCSDFAKLYMRGRDNDDETYDSQAVEGILSMLDYLLSLDEQTEEEEPTTTNIDNLNIDQSYARYEAENVDDEDLDEDYDEEEGQGWGQSM